MIRLLWMAGIVRTNQIWFRLLIPLTWLTVLSRRRLCHERRDTQGTVHPGGMQGRMCMIKAEKNPGRLGVHPGTSIAGVRQSGGGRRTSKNNICHSSDSLCTVAHIERNACQACAWRIHDHTVLGKVCCPIKGSNQPQINALNAI
jgi:hypothetical protein